MTHAEAIENQDSTFLFVGLLAYTVIYYTQIAGRYPILAPFRVEFVTGSILLLVIGVKILNQKIDISENKINYAALLFFLYMGFTIPFSFVISRASEQYLQFIKFFSIYLMMISCLDSEKRISIFFYLYLSMIALLFVEPFFLSLQGKGFQYNNHMMRLYGVTGFFAHPNQLGGITAANLPFFYYMFFYSRSILKKTLFAALIIIAIYVVMLTQSRTAFVGVLAFFFFTWIMSKHKAAMISIILLSLVITYPLIPEQTKERFSTLGKTTEIIAADDSKYAGDFDIGSMNSRWILFKRTITIFSEHPIMGIGMDCYSSMAGRRWGSWSMTHNLYTQVLAELGLIGFFLFLYFLSRIYMNIKISKSILTSKDDSSILFFIIKSLYMFLLIRFVIGLFGHDLYRNWWWVAAGLSVVVLRSLKKKYPDFADSEF
jgi:O-antigen ligase